MEVKPMNASIGELDIETSTNLQAIIIMSEINMVLDVINAMNTGDKKKFPNDVVYNW